MEEMEEVVKLVLPLLFGILASSGFWSYKTKKLERKYANEDKSEQILSSLEKLSKNVTQLLDNHTKTDAVTMAVARDRIYYLCDKAITNRDFRTSTMRDIKSIMEPYKANGGDGLADEFFDRYEHLYKTATGEINGTYCNTVER